MPRKRKIARTGKRYTLEMRKKILREVKSSKNLTKVARIHGIGRATIYKWMAKPEPKKESWWLRLLKTLGAE